MGPREFWVSLQESGQVVVPPPAPLTEQQQAAERAEHEEALRELHATARLELAYDAPALSMTAAVWAAERLYRACQFLVYREVDGQTAGRELATPCPLRPSPEACYSVDLALRWLPDLLALARGISPEDPLTVGLQRLGREWPLSSIGVAGVEQVDVSSFIEDRALRRLYADRVIELKDHARLKDPSVAEAVREALGGLGPQLAPTLALRGG